MPRVRDDDAVMTLVELALGRPAQERTSYVKSACGGDSELCREVLSYLEWEMRMNGFLLEPFYSSYAIEHPCEPGDLLDGRFRIVREVAQGGMGVVYEALDEKLSRTVALKCAKAGFGNRLPPEVRLATEISHPNVCKIFEIHTASTRFGEIDFVTMEFLAGETLAERLERGRLPAPEALAIARQLAAGLAEAHRNHVIHGDLKSNNVILTTRADGTVRAVITDFGLARGMEAAMPGGHLGVSAGTPAYMAPELWRGVRVSAASDNYALGVILHELLYGERPESECGTAPHRSKWDRVVARCLDPDPLRRFDSAEEIAEALAPPRRAQWWLAAAAAIVLAAGSVWVTYRSATAPNEIIRMALLPISAGSDIALAAKISRDVAAELGRLKAGKRVRLRVIPMADVARRHVDSVASARSALGATHVVQGALKENGKLVLHALVTDTHSQANVGDREFQYSPVEVRYAPKAVAGMVTAALHLPPPEAAPMKPEAKKDYAAGLTYISRFSTVDKALPLLKHAVAADSDSPLTWAALADAQWYKYFVTHDNVWLDQAAESLRQAEDRNPDVAAIHSVAGALQANVGQYERAETEYLRAIELEPGDTEAYSRLGQAYYYSGRMDEALASFRKAVELEPNYFKNYQNLGNYFTLRGNTAEAARQLETAVRLAPDEPEPHRVLGGIYLNLGRFGEAERELRTAVALGETPVALYHLATALMYQAKDEEAIPLLKRALAQSADQYLWWIILADADRRVHSPNDSARAYRLALELAEKEVAANPRDGVVRSRLAYLCARLGARARAASEIAQGLQLSPNSTMTRGMAVWTYEALGRREDALRVLESSPAEVVTLAGRWPDLAELQKDSRFQQLEALHQSK